MSRPVIAVAAATSFVLLASMGVAASPTAAHADGVISVSSDPVALGRALMADAAWVTGAEFVSKPPGGGSSGLLSGSLAGMPTSGQHAAILSTGRVDIIGQPNTDGSSGTDLGGGSLRGNTDLDVTVLKVNFTVPATVNCLVGMDFRFLSEEYPEWVGSAYNDAFIAELDKTTWTTAGSQINAPDNFAFDPAGNPITINSAGSATMAAAEAEGTTFDGATPLLTAATPLSPGQHSLYLSIFDQGDRVLDSAVIIDNLRMGTVGNPASECKSGATVVNKSKFVGLGDSYSSGFGVQPFYVGTHKDAGENDCQRSTLAYAPLVAGNKGLDLEFHACQGAVTQDFYQPRNSTWQEKAQLDHLSQGVGLVTFSIGGNDAKFADVLAECILGMELLPFNTCYKDDKVLKPVAEAISRLDGKASFPANITPYSTLYRDVTKRSSIATKVAVGYPHFYPAAGGDRTWLPGGRCEGVKKADQRWMVEKIDELNGVIEKNARSQGFLYAEPNFDGHELCGGGEEWIFGVTSAGKMHPKAAGQAAMSQAVLSALDSGGYQKFTVKQGQKVTYSFVVGQNSPFLSAVTGWPGSDVELTLVSPSGSRIERGSTAENVTRETGPTSEFVRVNDPETGVWTAELFGSDVAPEGEPVVLSVYEALEENERPTANITVTVAGDNLILDASSSSDPDGTIVGYDWYVSTAVTDEVHQGVTLTIPRDSGDERTITLVVTDDGGLTDFVDVAWIRLDVAPGSSVNPIKLTSKGVTPIAVLGTATFDVRQLDATSAKFGPGAAPASRWNLEDVDSDGYQDLVFHVDTPSLRLTPSSKQLCLNAVLENGRAVTSCDAIRAMK